MVSGLEAFIVSLRSSGFPLVLLWLLTLSIVYGLLAHANIPKSLTTRAVIAIVAAFLVLITAAASPAIAFMQNLITSSIVLAFGILLAVIFLEIGGVREEEKHVIAAHPRIFGGIILVIFVGIFVGAGGMQILGLPSIKITEAILGLGLFVAVMIAAIWLLYKETKGEKK